jgi:hypothetical protein
MGPVQEKFSCFISSGADHKEMAPFSHSAIIQIPLLRVLCMLRSSARAGAKGGQNVEQFLPAAGCTYNFTALNKADMNDFIYAPRYLHIFVIWICLLVQTFMALAVRANLRF